MTASIISWESAAATAARLAPAGPRLKGRQARAVVESIRYQATAAVDHVHRITGLDAAADLTDSQVLVVDRAGWARANSQSFATLLNGMLEGSLGERWAEMGELESWFASAGASVEVGGVLAFLSSKVLGQYDPFASLGGFGAAGGRLMLVAPNLVMLEQELNLDPEDFRLWVCLHEQTHRVQFAAAPWLRGHMLSLIQQLPQNVGESAQEMVARVLRSAGDLVRRRKKEEGAPPEAVEQAPALNPVPQNRVTRFLDPDSAEVFSQLTAIMSLMEGHANVVMDAVDSSVVPSVRTIRNRFESRRPQGQLDQLMRKALGMDLKMRQYKDGQNFVDAVVQERGMDAFNTVWQRAENLPTEAEVHNPQQWMERVLDGSTVGAVAAQSRGQQ